MLFKTVYGPELECLNQLLLKNGPMDKTSLYRAFVPIVNNEIGSVTNLDDALTFLVASKVIFKNKTGKYEDIASDLNFKLLLLSNLRDLQFGRQEANHIMDPWYIGLLDNLFVKKNQSVVFRIHQQANSLEIPEVLSEEKINAWRRVLEFIGIGNRLSTGFFCCYQPELILDILYQWEDNEGPLQFFLEEHLSKFLPWESESGDIAQALSMSLLILEREGYIILEQKQDLPNKCYFQERKIRWIKKEHSCNNKKLTL